MFSLMPTQRRPRTAVSPANWLEREFERLFDMVEQNGRDDLTASYPCDVREDEKTITIDAELPGFTREQVEVTLDNGVLRIRAERRDATEQPERKDRIHQHERRYARIERSIALPARVDESDVQASLQDGVLHIKLNKRSEDTGSKIQIQ